MIDLLTAVCILTSIGVAPDENEHFNFLASFGRRLSPDEREQSRGVGGEFQLMRIYTCPVCEGKYRPNRPTSKACSRTCFARFRELTIEKAAQRFWEWVNVGSPDECWIWNRRHKIGGGYGAFKSCGKVILAHRFSYFITYGEFPVKPYEVCHTCDNPPCCNPGHLFKGTRTENVLDCVRKGRNNPLQGEDSTNVKLTELQVFQILSSYIPRDPISGGAALGRMFGVTRSAIYLIVKRKNWAHL